MDFPFSAFPNQFTNSLLMFFHSILSITILLISITHSKIAQLLLLQSQMIILFCFVFLLFRYSSKMSEIMIPPLPTNRVKLSECKREKEDRFSDLPDCVILHILSFLNTELAVQTCILSSRYKDLWKRLPVLSRLSN